MKNAKKIDDFTINPGNAPDFLEVSKLLGGLWIISTYEKLVDY
jgi:hypothetical protein